MMSLVFDGGKAINGAAIGGSTAALFGMVTQSDFALWAGGLAVLGGAVLFLVQQYQRGAIETQRLERESILSDARTEIRELRKEVHDVRDELGRTRIDLALARAREQAQALVLDRTPATQPTPEVAS